MNLIYRGRSYQPQSIPQSNLGISPVLVKYRGISYSIPSNPKTTYQSLGVLKYRSVEYSPKLNHTAANQILLKD